ncbi:hypothetical protein Dimus_003669 [Dionaea muscipula]
MAKQSHALSKATKLHLPTTPAAAMMMTTTTTTLLLVVYYYFPSCNPNIIASSHALVELLSSICRRLQSRPFIYLILNLIIVSILLLSSSSSFSFPSTLSSTNRPIQSSTQPHSSSSPTSSSLTSSSSVRRSHSADLQYQIWRTILDDEIEAAASENYRSAKQMMEVDGEGLMWEEPSRGMLDQSLDTRSLEGEGGRERPPDMEKIENPIRRWEEEEKEKGETMDETWRAIMEGKDKMVTPQLKKSDTWSEGIRPCVLYTAGGQGRELKKSETFKDGELWGGGGGVRVQWRRRAAESGMMLSEDELNRRAEAFISKFRRDIWLQRKESDQRFLEMINRGL